MNDKCRSRFLKTNIKNATQNTHACNHAHLTTSGDKKGNGKTIEEKNHFHAWLK